MGALTKKEREALEDVFISIHAKSRFEQFQTLLQNLIHKTSRVIKSYSKKIKKGLLLLYIKSLSR
ncbi:hypothetical protein [Sulfurimonas sp.]|uniref:hypothetical protein n=1 Tax=Sulfurimonas sp. TaxID=2022749 RepID=UPI003D0DB6B0